MSQALDQVRDSDLLHGLDDAQVEAILDHARSLHFPSGQVVCREGEAGESMYLIASGRVKVSVLRDTGQEVTLNFLGRGNHFGELAMLIGAPRSATVTAVLDTELLELTRDDFHRLMTSVPHFAANLCRTLGTWLRQGISGRQRPQPIMVAAVVRRDGPAGRLARDLAAALPGDPPPLVLSDRADQWNGAARAIPQLDAQRCDAAALHGLIGAAVEQEQRVLLDVHADSVADEMLRQCEQVWWLALPADEQQIGDTLPDRIRRDQKLIETLQLVWVHRLGGSPPVVVKHDVPVAQADLRIAYQDGSTPRFRPHDVARLVHRLQGVRIGLALGGGGGRGMAHLGVLQALENEGIYFDRIVGTSAGALMGAFYSAGFQADQMIELMQREMTPPAWMRWMPQSKRWYLLTAFRLGLVDRKLRRYMGDRDFEQLLVPMHTVSVDLITGNAIVREQGDVIDAVLESINHPVFGKPILRPGAALVDGGVLVNVPATVLRQRDVDFVLAVDVGSKLGPHFVGNRPGMQVGEMRQPGYISTLIRVSEVQARSLASLHMSESDFLIAPDTSDFAFEDFTRGDELMEIGRAATEQALPQLKQALADVVRA
ncbi:MAG: cyclic nucleotide-binding and patatin-like phospholipase domain-containing protein [Pirellulaceae bacterium]